MENVENMPSINWFGGCILTRELLNWTKGAIEDEEDGFISKMNKENFVARMHLVIAALHQHGLSLDAAKFIQSPADGIQGFFTDVSPEALLEKMREILNGFQNGQLFKFRTAEFGSLKFQTA